MTIEDVGIIILSVYNHPNKWLQIPLEKALGKIHITHVEEHCSLSLIHVRQMLSSQILGSHTFPHHYLLAVV